MDINFTDAITAEGIIDELYQLRTTLENRINLSQQIGKGKREVLTGSKIMRICFIAGLTLTMKRDLEAIKKVQLSKQNQRFSTSFFTKNNFKPIFEAVLKLRYRDLDVDWNDSRLVSRIVAYEILRGRDHLRDENNLNAFLFATSTGRSTSRTIPELNLLIGNYGDIDMEATLSINDSSIPNTQILIAGATGSGKTNLLAVLIQQFRTLSTDSAFPVNFLLFDYKGEFSDPANASWLAKFDTDRTAILDPISAPLPINPFKDFRGKPQNEINLYSTEMANALSALERTSISANMSNRLAEAIVKSYQRTNGTPINFDMMLKEYQTLMTNPEKDDSISSVLKQLVRTKLFSEQDNIDLINECLIVKMDRFPKDGPIAKAIVYFLVSKLNTIYEKLERQAKADNLVQIRHFTIIDEAHYMLDFDNRPLRNLIAVGRDKGLSIILATQNMSSFKSKYFDFYANAQYPLIMKQQTIDDSVIRDLFGVSGKELQEIRSEIAGLQKGELIIKNSDAFLLGMGAKYKKIKVTHLI